MTDIALNINRTVITLGMPLDRQKLKEGKFRTLGLFGRLMIKKQKGEKIFWSKNCAIDCLDDKFTLFPNLDTSSGTDMMYGTSAYLYFKNKNLEKATFQLVGNAFAANWIIDKFREPATETFGEPRNEGNKTIWNDGQNDVIAEKLPDSQHAHFHWIKK